MKTSILSFIYFILLLISLNCCNTNRYHTISHGDQKKWYIINLSTAYKNKDHNDYSYFLVEASEGVIDEVLNRSYDSRYDFYDTISYRLKARCILDYLEKYWDNSCDKGILTSKDPNLGDSAKNEIIRKINDKKNYALRKIELKKYNNTQLFVRVSRLDNLNFCVIYSKMSLCSLPSADSIIILNKGFTMKPKYN